MRRETERRKIPGIFGAMRRIKKHATHLAFLLVLVPPFPFSSIVAAVPPAASCLTVFVTVSCQSQSKSLQWPNG
jgi:hypothetical protein